MASKRILMLVGDYTEDYEVMVPYQMLLMVGHQVDAVCPGKAAGERIVTAVHDFEGEQTYTERRGHGFALTATFDTIDPADYDALVLPGGRAPEYLRLDPRVLDLVRSFFEQEKPVAAICHGQQILVAAGVVGGRRCTAYPAMRPDLEQAGAGWVDPNATLSDAVVDGHLITAPAWPAHPAWIGKLLERLGTRIEP